MNKTYEKPNPYIAATFVTVNILQLLATLVANFLLCVAVYKVHALRTLANAFLVSLSFVDLGFVAVFASNIVLRTPSEGDHAILCFVSAELFHVLVCLEVLHLMAIAIDRLLAITLHLRYQQVVTGQRVAIAIAFIWIFGIAEASIPHMLLSNSEKTRSFRKLQQSCLPSKEFSEPWDLEVKEFIVIEKVVSIAVPYVVILLCYAWIFKISWRHHQQIYNQRRGGTTDPDHTIKVEMKAAKTTAIIVGSFSVTFTPLLGASLHSVFAVERTKSVHIFIHEVIPGLQALAGMSAFLNPLVYAWRYKPFREAFGSILKPFCKFLPHCTGSCVSRETEENAEGN